MKMDLKRTGWDGFIKTGNFLKKKKLDSEAF